MMVVSARYEPVTITSGLLRSTSCNSERYDGRFGSYTTLATTLPPLAVQDLRKPSVLPMPEALLNAMVAGRLNFSRLAISAKARPKRSLVAWKRKPSFLLLAGATLNAGAPEV